MGGEFYLRFNLGNVLQKRPQVLQRWLQVGCCQETVTPQLGKVLIQKKDGVFESIAVLTFRQKQGDPEKTASEDKNVSDQSR